MLFNQSSLFDNVHESVNLDLATGAITAIKKEERAECVMKVKMLKTAPGSIDGIAVETFEINKEYEIPKQLADAFVTKGYAKSLEAGPSEQKIIEPEETKEKSHQERTVEELKEIAKSMGIKGYTKLNKGELIQAIHSAVN